MDFSSSLAHTLGSFFGGIAGDIEESGNIKNNFFYGDAYAGIDRISYTGKAEPLSYEELLSLPGVPVRFGSFTISFTLDDEEVGSILVQHGASITEKDYPEPALSEDCYAAWETTEVQNITSNLEIKAEEHRFLTTLAGEELRENGQSVLLVDGSFQEGDALSIERVLSVGLPIENVTEHFVVEIPKDGALNHQFRYNFI